MDVDNRPVKSQISEPMRGDLRAYSPDLPDDKVPGSLKFTALEEDSNALPVAVEKEGRGNNGLCLQVGESISDIC